MQKKLLIIEDNKSISSVIKHLGDSLGYQATIAESFTQVKTLLAQKHDFFVATVDINLPDAPNGEVIPFVLEQNMPSIIMTGRMDEKTHRNVLNLPIIDYIIKENAQTYHYLLRILSAQLTNDQIGILLVDHSLSSRNQLANLLKRRNFSVYSANNATEALVYINKYPDIKMVITEQDMPVVNGIQLVQKIRKKYSANELIIIGISDANNTFQAERFIKNGADDFLKRPFSSEEFYCRIMQNIERLSYIEEIEKLANTDYLTGLFNRRYFIEQTKVALKKNYEKETAQALFFIHIDNFKTINEKHGHKAGNAVLIEMAKSLQHHFSQDIIAHISGSEFSVFLNKETLQIMRSALQNFHKDMIAKALIINELVITIKLSMGVQLASQDISLHLLLKGADTALIEATQQQDEKLIIYTE